MHKSGVGYTTNCGRVQTVKRGLSTHCLSALPHSCILVNGGQCDESNNSTQTISDCKLPDMQRRTQKPLASQNHSALRGKYLHRLCSRSERISVLAARTPASTHGGYQKSRHTDNVVAYLGEVMSTTKHQKDAKMEEFSPFLYITSTCKSLCNNQPLPHNYRILPVRGFGFGPGVFTKEE